MKKSGGAPQTGAKAKLPSTQWIPGRIAVEYVHARLPGYSRASVGALLLSAITDRQIKIRYEKNNPGMPYGHDHQTVRVATVRDLFFKRNSLKVWADKIAPDESEQDDRRARARATSATAEDDSNPKSSESMKKMIIGMAIAKYNYDPKSDRNKATAEILADLHRLGLNLSADTVRKWLREAADCLPSADAVGL